MAGKTYDVDEIISKDQVGCDISEKFHSWDKAREPWKKERVEVKKYVFATDTGKTSAGALPWSNKTHIPKLCQIRDNLFANYVATIFPKRRWMRWEGRSNSDQTRVKEEAIRDYMTYVTSQDRFKHEIYKLIYDYIDDGNSVVTTEWVDETQMVDGILRPGYVGPVAKRISPLDVVVNPLAPSFAESPKIIRSLWTMGEARSLIDSMTSTPEQKEVAQEVFKYMSSVRERSALYDFKEKDEFLHVDGFGSYRDYLNSGYVEVLTFLGDYYDNESNVLHKNYQIVVVDRHKVIFQKTHQTLTGLIPVHHSGWRTRQDNVWAMGPLDNLVGMQYRIDHVENMKADIFDLTTYPPLKVKGIVEDFEWGPFERIYVDGDGDVEMMAPRAEILTANIEIQGYEQRMEEMAGAPKEALGFRTPGEKTAYEVQRLENAASRIFQQKIAQFEEQIIEPLLNDMLALARENLTETTIRVIDDEFKSASFRDITKEDLSAQGRLKPIAARHFAEKAELVQNLNNFFNSSMGQDPNISVHFSGVRLAELMEEVLDIKDFEVVQKYVRLHEQADAQRLSNVNEEEVQMEAMTPAGIAEDDTDEE